MTDSHGVSRLSVSRIETLSHGVQSLPPLGKKETAQRSSLHHEDKSQSHGGRDTSNSKSNLKLWFKLTDMPQLSHWPNREKEFSYEESLVIQFIAKLTQTNSRHAVSLFNQAKKNGCIVFDQQTKLWKGNTVWEP
jgi:hypothetical protein